MLLPTNNTVFDCCANTLIQASANQSQPVTELKQRLHSHYAIPNRIIDEFMLIMADTMHADADH